MTQPIIADGLDDEDRAALEQHRKRPQLPLPKRTATKVRKGSLIVFHLTMIGLQLLILNIQIALALRHLLP